MPNVTALVLNGKRQAKFKIYHSSTSVLQCHGHPCTSHGNSTYTEIVFHLNRTNVENNTEISVAVLEPETGVIVEENFTVIISRWSFAVGPWQVNLIVDAFLAPVHIEKVPNKTVLIFYDEMLARFKIYYHSSTSVLQCHGPPCTSHGNDTYTEIEFYLNRTNIQNNTVVSVAVLEPGTDHAVVEENFTVIIGT